jgi:hypothetical protein
MMANDTKVRVEPSGDTVKIIVDSPRTGGCKQVDVQLDITAPKDVSLKYRVDVGDVVVTAITGDISGVTDVGNVKCSGVFGNLDIAVDVGKINAQYEADAPGARNIQLSTDVGDIALTAPSAFSAKLHAKTNVGSFDTELPLTIVGSLGKGAVGRDVQGTIGEGEGQVELKTDVGSIKIK